MAKSNGNQEHSFQCPRVLHVYLHGVSLWLDTYVYTYIRIYVYTYIRIRTQIKNIYVYTYMHVSIHACMHAYIRMLIN